MKLERVKKEIRKLYFQQSLVVPVYWFRK